MKKLEAKAKKAGVSKADVGSLIKESKKPDMPVFPRIQSTADMDDEDASRQRAKNAAQCFKFLNTVARLYEKDKKKLTAARYFEDVKQRPKGRSIDLSKIDLSALDDDQREVVENKLGELQVAKKENEKLERTRLRELKTRRKPMAKRRAERNATSVNHPGPVRNFADAKKASQDQFTRFFASMLEGGVYLAPSSYEAAFVSLAHRKADISQTLEVAAEALHHAARA